MNPITLVVADDQMLTREGLRTILDLEEDIRVVGVAKNGVEACEMVEQLQPDLVLLDVQMPIMDGLTALKRIKQNRPETCVLILTTFIDTDYIVEGMANGASGYMLKDMDGDKMIASIHDAIAGQFILPSLVAAKLAEKLNVMHRNQTLSVSPNRGGTLLKEREVELARLIIKGLNNREIANVMFIAEGTVRNYISNLYSKLEVVDRAQAIIRLQEIVQAAER
jgi:DNA-binding NarL/FixJ family response regulator